MKIEDRLKQKQNFALPTASASSRVITKHFTAFSQCIHTPVLYQ